MPESYIENALAKLARQLVAFDEASLMDLWEKYAETVRQFEPTRHWEEAALIFSFIQAVRMKNQLFNYNLAAARRSADGHAAAGPQPLGGEGFELLDLTAPEAGAGAQAAGAAASERPGPARTSVRERRQPKAGKIIPLRRGQH